jgi:hypothetical protein
VLGLAECLVYDLLGTRRIIENLHGAPKQPLTQVPKLGTLYDIARAALVGRPEQAAQAD